MKKRGFTLIELLMVSAIISLLMSVVFFRVTEAKKKGEDAHMKIESAEVAKAVYQYKEDNGGFVPGAITVAGPLPATGPVTLIEGSEEFGGDDYIVAMQELVTDGYLSEIPYSPSGDDYSYIISADGTQAVFAADLNFPLSSGGGDSDRNSCEWTDAGNGGGGSGEPPCSEPELPPDIESLYGITWYDWNIIPGNGAGSYPENLVGSCNQTYPQGFSGDLYDYWNANGYTCVDKTPANFSSLCTCSGNNYVPTNPDATPAELCQSWGNSNCGGISSWASGYDSFVYDPGQFADVREYDQLYEQPYVQEYEEYDQCLVDNADEYNDDGDWIGGGDGGDGDICDGSSNSDYCSCM